MSIFSSLRKLKINPACLFGHEWKYCIEVAKYNPDQDIDQWITNVPNEIIKAMQNPMMICTVCKKVKPATNKSTKTEGVG